MRYAERQPRRVMRAGDTDPLVRIRWLEDDADQNEREHVAAEENLASVVTGLRGEVGTLAGKLDRVTWTLAATAISLAATTVALVVTRL